MRPPLVVKNKSDSTGETEGFCCDAQFGREYDGTKAKFYISRRFKRERATLCYQAVLFGFADPARFIDEQNEKLGDPAFLFRMLGLGSEGRRKLKCGIPASLLVGWDNAFKRLTNFEVYASRAVVFGSDLVDIGKVRLLPRTYREFSKKYRSATGHPLRKGAKVVLHRDPALPDSSSMHVFTYSGQAMWATDSSAGIGIVLNPADPHWKRAGGDFDGDAAVIFPVPERHASRPTLPPMKLDLPDLASAA